MASIAALLSAGRNGPGSFAAAIPDDWMQGRTAFGGLSAAIAYDSARSREENLPPIRSAQIAFVGPVSGSVTAEATLLRRGKSSAFIEVRAMSGDSLALVGTFLFMAERPSPIELLAARGHGASPPRDSAPAMLGQGGPAYRSQLEFRHAAPPETRGKPEFLRWVRLKERDGVDQATELLLVADSLPTPVVPLLKAPVQVSSANWGLHFHQGRPGDADGWWLVGSKTESAAAGISYQSMGVWDQAGHAMLTSSQTVSYFSGA